MENDRSWVWQFAPVDINTLIDGDTLPHSKRIYLVKNFCKLPQNCKICESFYPQKIPAIRCYSTWSPTCLRRGRFCHPLYLSRVSADRSAPHTTCPPAERGGERGRRGEGEVRKGRGGMGPGGGERGRRGKVR